MNYWIVPSNKESFDLDELLKEHNVVSWRSRNRFQVGDVVFIYSSSPTKRITYQMFVSEVDVQSPKFDESKYWGEKYRKEKKAPFTRSIFQLKYKMKDSNELSYNSLVAHGLKGTIQSNRMINGPLLEYVINAVKNNIIDDTTLEASPDYITDTSGLYEGTIMQVCINKYERNHEARERCLAIKGYKCSVCGMNFEKVYGEIGHGFIHVHHIVPLSTIGKNYIIDPIKDLVPVCPNCHSMLHKGCNGVMLSVDELKKRMKETNGKDTLDKR